MKTVMIMLSSIDDIRTLVDTVVECDYDVDLSSGNYTVDAKSILGIFGMDLSKPIELTAYGDNVSCLMDKIKSFTV